MNRTQKHPSTRPTRRPAQTPTQSPTTQHQRLNHLDTLIKTLVDQLPKILDQQSLTSSFSLTRIIESCHDLLSLTETLRRETVSRDISIRNMGCESLNHVKSKSMFGGGRNGGDGCSWYEKGVEEWSVEERRLGYVRGRLLERGIGWIRKNSDGDERNENGNGE